MNRTESQSAPPDQEAELKLFAVAWALASIYHVTGPSARSVGFLSSPTEAGFGHVVLAIAALLVMARPERPSRLMALAILGPITAWQESPFLGSHWLLATLVNFGLLMAAVTAVRNGGLDRAKLAAAFLPLLRWTLIAFYSFAAFAKLNSAFLDSNVSCASVYFDQIAASMHIATPIAVGSHGWAALVPATAALTELTIPVALIGRRTRALGVVLGLLFHGVISLNGIHLFTDFSSVLTAMLIPFLGSTFAHDTERFFDGEAVRHASTAFVVLVGCVLAAQLSAGRLPTYFIYARGRLLSWFIYDLATITATCSWLIRSHSARLTRSPLSWSLRPRWLAILPLLVVTIGTLPYLELQTAFAFTMYSNLRMVDGRSNHLLVRASLPVGHRYSGRVRILWSTDPGLAAYIGARYDIAWDSFCAYMYQHPGSQVRYLRLGKVVDFDNATIATPQFPLPSMFLRKLFPLRSVDQSDPPRCQDSFLRAL
ncbi:MAG TPA: hypothetical protein VJN96_03360 [Vicinamibacterales bacterium]|nr:hypothetical protein [Vicinamibacterales bacterium]